MKKNRLQFETSPYLKQHEHNPVDWYPWGEEALNKAKSENKPILLSVGYSACHWCHVMAHECFENPQVAELMNQHFVNIKVDREERPDLDQIYQPVAQMITKGGGWPLTVFLTPQLKPFYGGTYFPPTDRYGRPGFPRLIQALANSYQTKREEVLERADKMTDILQDADEFDGGELKSKNADQLKFHAGQAKETLKQALDSLLGLVDLQNGGMGSAPKFPNPMIFHFLWRMSQMDWVEGSSREAAQEAVHLTLKKMGQGGIFDQLGGGFHRYSVDGEWAVPHFEKMLYDNALLLKLYSEVLLTPAASNAQSAEQKKLYSEILIHTVEYIEREMISPQGIFYAAQDADSEGEEGKFFVWDRSEIEQILDQEEAKLFCEQFGITEQGNFENGKTVLAIPQDIKPPALTEQQKSLFKIAKNKVFLERELRVRPGLDHKCLVSWNGLMISGLCWATLALENVGEEKLSQRTKKMALTAYEVLKDLAAKTNYGLAATIQLGQARFDGYLDDYAFMSQAALDLARIDLADAEKYFKDATHWCQFIFENFKDGDGPGFYFTRAHQEDLIHRPKSFFDQAIPSGNAVAYQLCSVLSEAAIANAPQLLRCTEAELPILMRSISQNPYGLGELLNALLLKTVGPVLVKGVQQDDAQMPLKSPFCFFENGSPKSGPVQFCHQQTCQLDQFDFKRLFKL